MDLGPSVHDPAMKKGSPPAAGLPCHWASGPVPHQVRMPLMKSGGVGEPSDQVRMS